MAKTTQLLSVLARINPAIFDVIFPHGPVLAQAFASRLSEAALNPQPLPPEPPPERLQRVSALVAHNIAFAAIAAEAAGQDGGVHIINSAIDDWCGNGRPPIPIPWPGPWPFAFALDAVPEDSTWRHRDWSELSASQPSRSGWVQERCAKRCRSAPIS